MAGLAQRQLIPVMVHRGQRTACIPADASASAGTIARQAFSMMEEPIPDGAAVGLARADGTVLDLSARVEAHATLYAILRLPGGQWDVPQRPPSLADAEPQEGEAPHRSDEALTQRLPPALAQYVMAQRPSPVVL